MEKEQDSRKWRLLVVDDHPIIRRGLKEFLECQEGMEVVGEAADGAGALRLARETLPDLVIMDIILGGLSGLEVTRLLQEPPRIKVLVFTACGDEANIGEALRSGASGYVFKPTPLGELVRAILAVCQGGMYFPSEVLGKFSAERELGERPQLTPREKEILQQVAQGLTNKEIAHQLSLSARTVETHRQHLMEKLGIHTVAGLTRYAIAAGLI